MYCDKTAWIVLSPSCGQYKEFDCDPTWVY
jgi:hypothetical protein